MGKIRVHVGSAKEYREKMKHADGLDLSLEKVHFMGAWESDEGNPVFLSGNYDIEGAGHKYLKVRVTSPSGEEVVKVHPVSTRSKDEGEILLTLRG